jgi:hypothetical protein
MLANFGRQVALKNPKFAASGRPQYSQTLITQRFAKCDTTRNPEFWV